MKFKAYLQRKFINFLVHNLFNAIDERDILQIRQDGLYHRNKRVLDETTTNILKDVDLFKNSILWKTLSDEVRFNANLKMFYKSCNTDDIIAGKMALWVIELMDKKLKELSIYRERRP